METIKFTPECVESFASEGALAHRDRVLEHFRTAPGLGPVDLVWCRKAAKGAFGEQQSSFFHQVIGHDLTSTASAAAYFAELSRNTEQVGFVSGLFTSLQWSVTQCVYCCFDAFSRLDVRCHMSVPGGVTAYAIDSKGERFDMTSAHWKRVSVSAFLRYEYYHPSIFRGVPGVIQLQGMRTPDAEESILDSVVDLYYDRIPPEVLNMLRPGGQRGAAHPEDNDPMLGAVLQHFKRRRVFEGAVEFFTQVASLHAPAVVHLCVALDALGRTEDALQVLRSNALRMPNDSNIICALANAEAAAGNTKDALQLARHALMLSPKSTTALICMARIQAQCGAPALSVLAMHLIVPPSDPNVLIRRIYPCGLPGYDRITQPSCRRFPLEEEEATILDEERKLPRKFGHGATNWMRVVKELCGILEENAPDELPDIPADVHTDTATLRTSVVRLLPHIQGVQHQIIATCMRKMGMHNFMRALQVLSRSASEKAKLITAVGGSGKISSPPLQQERERPPKRRNKRFGTAASRASLPSGSSEFVRDSSRGSTVPFGHPPAPRAHENGDSRKAMTVPDDSAESTATGGSPKNTARDSISVDTHHEGSRDAIGKSQTDGTDGGESDDVADPPSVAADDEEEPGDAEIHEAKDEEQEDEEPAELGGPASMYVKGVDGVAKVIAGEPSQEVPTISAGASMEQIADDPPSAPVDAWAQAAAKAPPAPRITADLSFVPADLVSQADTRMRQAHDAEPHPVGEGLSSHPSCDSLDSGSHPSVRLSSLQIVPDCSNGVPGAALREASPLEPDESPHGQQRSLGERPGLQQQRSFRASPVAEGLGSKSSGEYELLSPQQQCGGEYNDVLGATGSAGVGEAAMENRSASGGHRTPPQTAGGMSVPMKALREALNDVEAEEGSVHSDKLGRLQMRAQEDAARVTPPGTLRPKRFKKLQLGSSRQRSVAKAATSEGQSEGGSLEDVGTIVSKLVDSLKLQTTAERLLEDARDRRSMRNAEALHILAALMTATEAPEGIIQELSMHVANLVTCVLQDLDDTAYIHSAAVNSPDPTSAKGLHEATELVQTHCHQFLQFQHHPLGGVALPDSTTTTRASVGDWLAWGAASERLGCPAHARYAYAKGLLLVQPHRCMTANLSLARLIGADADIHTVFDHVTEVLLFMDYRRDQVVGTSEAAQGVIKEGEVSATIVAVLATVIDAWGMAAVQNRLEKGSGQYHPSIDPVIEQAFGWGTDGCDA